MCERKCVFTEIKEGIREFLEFNGNEYAACTISWNTKKMNVELRRKFTAPKAYMKKIGELSCWQFTSMVYRLQQREMREQ